MRLFLGIWPPPGVTEVLVNAQAALRRPLPRGLVRWVIADQLHLTLRFLGEVADDQVKELERTLNAVTLGMESFPLRVRGLGAFPEAARARVVWAGLAGDLDRLEALQRAVADAVIPFVDRPEAKAFHPHVTLGRVRDAGSAERRALAEALERAPKPDSAAWRAMSIRLVRSELGPGGAVYTTVAEIPLDRTR